MKTLSLFRSRPVPPILFSGKVAEKISARGPQTAINGNNAWSIGTPAGSSWSSPGKGGEVTHGRGAWVMSSPKKRTEYTRLRWVPSTPAEACRLSM